MLCIGWLFLILFAKDANCLKTSPSPAGLIKAIRKVVIGSCLSLQLLSGAPSLSLASTEMVDPPGAIAPSDAENNLVRMAFKDWDDRRFDAADKEFGLSLKKWDELNRPRDEKVSLLKARANVRVDNKKFDDAMLDYNLALQLMKPDGEKADGTATYPEYPDAFVGRGLAYEGLAKWDMALKDYNKAIELWGGGRGENVNPYVLSYRGNVLGRLGKLNEAAEDYQASSDMFNSLRDIARSSDARANYALVKYQMGEEEAAVKAMKDVIRKNPGFGDMHVALAADDWGKGDYINALKEWRFVCDKISTGCAAYEDKAWVEGVRRWPPQLVDKLQQFLNREVPDKLKGSGVLAPVKSK